MNAVNSVAPAMSIRGDRFAKVGSNDAVPALVGPNTRKVDLQGKTVIPRGSLAITGEDNIKGSIEAGKPADFVVISDDLLNLPKDRIRDVSSVMTVVGGKEVYKR